MYLFSDLKVQEKKGGQFVGAKIGVLGKDERGWVIYAEPATKAISWRGSQPCKKMLLAEKEQCA